jgi:hypothetical protein
MIAATATIPTMISASVALVVGPVGVAFRSSPGNRGADSDHAQADDECGNHHNTSNLAGSST